MDSVEINISHINNRYGENIYKMEAINIDGEILGFVDFGEYNGVANIKFISVEEESKRQGIAESMLQKIQDKYDGTEIEWGMLTPDGSKLYDKVTRKVLNPKFDRKLYDKILNKKNKINKMQKEVANIKELQRPFFSQYRDGKISTEDREKYSEINKREEELKDMISDLSMQIHELTDKSQGFDKSVLKPTLTFIDTKREKSLDSIIKDVTGRSNNHKKEKINQAKDKER